MMEPVTDASQKKIVRIYGAFGAGLVLFMVPLWSAAIVSTALILGVLITAYVLRTDTEHGSLTENHMTFIIRTFWIGNLFALVAIMVASVYLFMVLDTTPMQPCVDLLVSKGHTLIDPAEIESVATKCVTDVVRTNMTTLIVSAVVTAMPILIYFAARYIRGLTRAMRGYRVANPKAWF